MTDTALILNVIRRTRCSATTELIAFIAVYAAAHPNASGNEARAAYFEACGELEAML